MTTSTTFNQARFDELTAKIDYTAKFIPFSQSRNQAESQPTLNWVISLKSGRTTLATDYSAGVGHIPGYKFHELRKYGYAQAVAQTCETGKNHVDGFGRILHGIYRPLAAPAKADIFYSLLMDSDAINYESFEDWADNFGYDSDSRKALAIYRACMKTALKFRKFLTPEELNEVQELFSDY